VDPSGNLDSDYMVMMQYLEKQQEAKNIIDQLPPGFAAGFANGGMAVYQNLPSNILGIINTGTGGGGGAVHEPAIEEPLLPFVEAMASVVLPCGVIITDHVRRDYDSRGWSDSGISDAFLKPVYTSPSVNKINGNPATAYYRSKTSGDYVVIDDVTMETVQVGRSWDQYWYPAPEIKYPIPAGYGYPLYGRGYQLPPGYYGPDMYGNWPR
jgi:hypothetical protein